MYSVGVLFFFFFLIQLTSLCLWVGAFNPFTVKVIIDKYDPVAIYILCVGGVVRFYKHLLCFLSREDPLVFVEELVWRC